MRHLFLISGMFLFASTLAAQCDVFKSQAECKIGTRVTDKANKSGKIVRTDNGLCQVRLDDGTESSYIFWMLRSAGASAETNDRLVPGTYECFQSGRYTFMDMQITGPNTYSSAGSSGRFHVEPSRKIVFESGSLAKYYAHLLAGPAIGLNTNNDSFWSTTCELKK